MLIVADGAPGLIKAIEHGWPASDRQHCAVHRLRNLLAKLPEAQRDPVRHAYWRALDDALNPRDAKQRLRALVDELEAAGLTSAARCLADDLERPRRAPALPNPAPPSLAQHQPPQTLARRRQTPHQHGALPRRRQLPDPRLSRPGQLITHETNGINFTELDRQDLNHNRYTAPDAAAEEPTAA